MDSRLRGNDKSSLTTRASIYCVDRFANIHLNSALVGRLAR